MKSVILAVAVLAMGSSAHAATADCRIVGNDLAVLAFNATPSRYACRYSCFGTTNFGLPVKLEGNAAVDAHESAMLASTTGAKIRAITTFKAVCSPRVGVAGTSKRR